MNFYNEKICLNVLANCFENAKEIYETTNHCSVIGVLSSNYENVQDAVNEMQLYSNLLEGNLSVGLGGGNPKQCAMVAEISKHVDAYHFNQVFSYVGNTRAVAKTKNTHINSMVSPSGIPGKVIISTGPLSKDGVPAIIEVETAILMIKEMGGNAIKFFPMRGLETKDELIAVARACAKHDLILEPTGSIDLDNFEEIVRIILDNGVKKVIPHVYSSIIDKESGCTKIGDVEKLMEIIKKITKV